MTTEVYIETYKTWAIAEMKRSGIPASITLAQGILESGNGNSRLAVEFKNHFGIKCHDTWKGDKAYHDDDQKGECFRHYKSAEESFRDHTDFLMSRSRYAFLFDYKPTDYTSWAKGLKKAGYATDSRYSQRLIELIEQYNLHRYDDAELSAKVGKNRQTDARSKTVDGKPGISVDNFSVHIEKYVVKEINRTEYIRAKAGDTYASLASMRDMMLWQLPKYNDAPASKELAEGEIVYLQPKRRRAARGRDTHRLREGETMHEVSQIYAVRLNRLYVLNHLEKGAEPKAGTLLNLRKKKMR
ncbi:MAG: glucosaminidase domain-containing protein [Bacteroidales bacterium]|nr:glucosaminidase domain-containing protein [Bacteroidales bacterium]